MIRPLRQRHRHVFAVLAIVLPVAFVVGMVARRPVPAMNMLPPEISGAATGYEIFEWRLNDLFATNRISTVLLRKASSPASFALQFSAPKDFAKPDVIVYWIPGDPHLAGKLPDDAFLLGAFNSSGPLPLPHDAESAAGVVVLYSLADDEIVDATKQFTIVKQ